MVLMGLDSPAKRLLPHNNSVINTLANQGLNLGSSSNSFARLSKNSSCLLCFKVSTTRAYNALVF